MVGKEKQPSFTDALFFLISGITKSLRSLFWQRHAAENCEKAKYFQVRILNLKKNILDLSGGITK